MFYFIFYYKSIFESWKFKNPFSQNLSSNIYIYIYNLYKLQTLNYSLKCCNLLYNHFSTFQLSPRFNFFNIEE